MRKVSFVILIIFTIAITTITIYTLTHKHIKGTQEVIKIKTIEKASSNMSENELNEVYNIELNGKRHRLKSNYRLSKEDKVTSLILYLYLDGFKILEKEILSNIKDDAIDEIFTEDENTLLIEEDNIHIIKEDQDYLLVSISQNIDGLKEEYFVWTDKRKNILDSILVYDEKIKFTLPDEEDLDMFYDKEKIALAKLENNKIYTLELNEKEEQQVLEKYSYTIDGGKAKKELLTSYEIKKAQ